MPARRGVAARFWITGWIGVCAACLGCTAAAWAQVPSAAPPGSGDVGSTVIMPGSVLACRIILNPNDRSSATLQRLQVQPDGTIDLGQYGILAIAGMTCRDASQAIVERVKLMTRTSSPSGNSVPAAIIPRQVFAKENMPSAYEACEPPLAESAPASIAPPVRTVPPVQTVPPAQSVPRAARIVPGDTLKWSIAELPGFPGSRIAGKGVINADGYLSLGEYGSVRVAGLTMDQAESTIQAHIVRSAAREPRTEEFRARATPPVEALPRGYPAGSSGTVPPPVAQPVQPAAPTRQRGPVIVDGGNPSGGIQRAGYQQEVKEQTIMRAWYPPTIPDAPPTSTPFVPVAAGSSSPIPIASSTPVLSSAAAVPAQSFVTQAGPPGVAAPPPPPKAEPIPSPKVAQPPAPAAELHTPTPIPASAEMLAAIQAGARGAPRELAMASLPAYVLDPPDIILVESTQGLRDQPIRGQHLIRPDGSINLGIYGAVYVAGMTLEQARVAVGKQLSERIKDFDLRNLTLDVLAYNSKVYYVITDGGGYGEQVYRIPITGSETVLDALSQINGLPPVASKRNIWVARRTPGSPDASTPPLVYPVDWCAITQQGISATNYQVLPGDRIYVKADRWRTFDAALAKVLSPVQRVLGISLLGSATVNSIKNGTSSTGALAIVGR